MPTPLGFAALTGILPRRIAPLPDHRQHGPNTRYTLQDAAWGAFGIFFTQSASFLEYQRRLQHTQGHTTVHTLVGVEQIPCDHQGRTLLDPLAPSPLEAVFVEVFERLEQPRMVTHFRGLDAQLLGALDGPHSLSSKAMHCPNCLTRHLTKGQPLSDHAAITPVIVCPGQSQVLALPPADIMPQDGQAQQDCERAASKRWLSQHAAQIAPHGVTVLGAALYSHQPFCALVLQPRCQFILTCQPDSHPQFYERIAWWQATDAIATRAGRHGPGRFTEVPQVRYLNDGLLRRGDDAWSVHWFDITVIQATTGAQLYQNSCIPHHRLTADHVVHVAQAGRGRWKIVNENNNVLKTTGDHLEHNCGHGTQSLAAFLLSLNLLAFLFHTGLEWSAEQYAVRRRVLARRQTFFHDIPALRRYMVFDSWEHWMAFMLRGLELASQVNTS